MLDRSVTGVTRHFTIRIDVTGGLASSRDHRFVTHHATVTNNLTISWLAREKQLALQGRATTNLRDTLVSEAPHPVCAGFLSRGPVTSDFLRFTSLQGVVALSVWSHARDVFQLTSCY